MIDNMLKLNKKKKWYKIEIITIHVQHAGLIFLMQIFVFFYIIEQAIKLMRFAGAERPN